jgi:hypothetical protein
MRPDGPKFISRKKPDAFQQPANNQLFLPKKN